MNNININDVAKRCGKYCSDCIVPCSTCHMGKCEQCRYGYKSVVEKLLEKFTAEQLIPCDRCNNNDICKYKDQVIEVNNKISEVVFSEESPIEINVRCKKFVNMKTNIR